MAPHRVANSLPKLPKAAADLQWFLAGDWQYYVYITAGNQQRAYLSPLQRILKLIKKKRRSVFF